MYVFKYTNKCSDLDPEFKLVVVCAETEPEARQKLSELQLLKPFELELMEIHDISLHVKEERGF